MCKICVFGGTSEGRLLSEFLTGAGADVTCCVATAYGGELLEPSDNLTVSAKRLPENEIEAMLTSERFDVVVDATHPYAAHITESIAEACNATNTGHIRLLRDAGGAVSEAVCVSSTAEAVEYLNNTQGNILLTTGSKELAAYSGIEGFAQRVYARVLPMADSLDSCVRAGLKPAHILAMQGPFSRELNIALLKSVNASYLVTKDGGNAGGFGEKA
ncbi:MAG: precorrin-6A reductase, partial [Oscillospiraceae bacterium]|nr:precorrin-6A reductase [Oscillospiraceae bacterium]